MPASSIVSDPLALSTFGELLRYVRRRARLTQRDLGIAVGYSESHINRFEKNKHLPDPATVAALFVPALDLVREPQLAARLIELASPSAPTSVEVAPPDEPIPQPAPHEVARLELLARLRKRLIDERCVALVGLPGVGKTTLASAIAREFEARQPVFWLTLTSGITTSADAILLALANFLAGLGHDFLKPLTTRPIGMRDELPLDRRVILIGQAVGRQPLLICIDNAELIRQEETVFQVLQHLMSTTAARFLFTTRESLPLTVVAEIPIVGLEPAESLALIHQSGGLALSASQAQRLMEKTAGSPMLLRLALGKLTEPLLDVEITLAHLETQPTIAAYLLRTLRDQMAPAAWRLLCLLSVFNQTTDLYDARLDAIALDLGETVSLGDAIRELQRRQLIDDATRARLHPLVRDFVYRVLEEDPARAQRLHRLAGDWLMLEPKDPQGAARHYALAGLLELAIDAIEEHQSLLTVQGKAAQTVSVLDQILSEIRSSHGDGADLRRRALTLRGILLRGTLRVEEGEANLREALSLAVAPAVRASISAELAEILSQRYRFQELFELMEAVNQDLAVDDRLLRARFKSLAVGAHSSLGQPDAARQAAADALALTTSLPPRVTSLIRSRTHIELANVARIQLDTAEAMRQAQAAVAAARDGDLARAMYLHQAFVGGLYFDLGNLEASFRQRQEALDGLLAIGDIHSAAYILTYLADIHHVQLEQARAIEELTRASDIFRTVNDLRGLASSESPRAGELLWQGQTAAARQVVDQLLVETEGKSTERTWGYRLNKRAMIQLVQGETDAALATLERALALPSVKTYPMLRFELYTTLAVAQIAMGRLDLASDALVTEPKMEGLSRWAEFERDLVDGYRLLFSGDVAAARAVATRLEPQVAPFVMYRELTLRLCSATDGSTAPDQVPALLWVGAAPLSA